MTTLIAVYTSRGCIGRCDANCYNAKTDRCSCVCGGRNHGAGIDAAAQITREALTAINEEIKAGHPEGSIVRYQHAPPALPETQKELFS